MITGETYTVHIGSNLDVLPTLKDNSIDSIVTDPPYELGFMGKKWDSSGIAYSIELWKECLRVLKPGGHLLSFGGTRTWHRVAVAIEDAGFEVRDSIAWMYGSGFPKSLDVSKAIDKAAGAEREVLTETVSDLFGEREERKEKPASGIGQNGSAFSGHAEGAMQRQDSGPATPEAKQWEGWGTALKPAFEPIVVARKPLMGTVAENVLTHGTGALNIDGSRIGTRPGEKFSGGLAAEHSEGWDRPWKHDPDSIAKKQERIRETIEKAETLGRWPANVILDEYSAEILDEQSGVRSPGAFPKSANKRPGEHFEGGWQVQEKEQRITLDSGGASRFFYVAKASKRDRNEGLEELEAKYSARDNGFSDKISDTNQPRQNFHPTVKPTDLMRYLVKLVTPPNGTVLDPFTGSGSTGKAAILEGFRFVGIELTEDYIPIIKGRLKHAEAMLSATQDQEKEKLF
jgi:site-specific DNA-methyltransferase (adenine-specific)